MIALLGSVFSPYYAWAGRRDPLDHCAFNVALYGEHRRWTMTERRRHAVSQTSASLGIGPSRMTWDGDVLTLDLDEIAVPLPSRVRGTVRLRPAAINGRGFLLDAAGRHRWRPLAPAARVEVSLERPSSSWTGHAYFDTNDGDEPLEDAFRGWTWSRAQLGGGEAAIFYDVEDRDGRARPDIALHVNAGGQATDIRPPPGVSLPRSTWRLGRATRSDGTVRLVQALEDGPFYTRSVVQSEVLGQTVTAVTESLSLTRFATPWVKLLLPFRMPRRLL